MVKFALIGYPLSHSISSVIHKAALKSVNIDGEYELLQTDPEDLVSQVKFLKSRGYLGFNVTIPLKVPITLFLDQVDEISNIAGCSNTVKILPDMSLAGFNTDVFGFLQAIPQEIKQSITGSNVAILGNGGAARAVCVALNKLGVKRIDFYVRNIINASNMISIVRKNFPFIEINSRQIQNVSSLKDYSMLINTTPLGMRGKSMGVSPVDESLIKTLPKEAVVYDIVYNPIKTELLKYAEDSGLKTINGIDMLVFQAAKAFEIWTGKIPDTQEMKIAALESLSNF